LGIPALLGWQVMEGGQWRRGRGAPPRESGPPERRKGAGD
jgi:hypothetical protein